MKNENLTPCPLERPVGRVEGETTPGFSAFTLSFRSWLLNIWRNLPPNKKELPNQFGSIFMSPTERGKLVSAKNKREKEELLELNTATAGLTIKSIEYSGHWGSVFISFLETDKIARIGTDCGLSIEIFNKSELPESLKNSWLRQ